MKIVIDSLAGLKNGKVYSPMFGERVLEITLDNDKVETPSYAMSQTDLNSAAILSGHLLPPAQFNTKVAEIKRSYSIEELSAMASDSTGELIETEISWINGQISRLRSASNVLMFIFIPIIEGDTPLSRQIADLLVSMQIETDLKIISVPDCQNYKGAQTLSMFKQAKRKIVSKGKYAFYMIPMGYKPSKFKSKIGKVLKVAKGIIGIYDDFDNNRDNFFFIATLYNQKIVRAISNVPRRYPSRTDESIICLLSLICDIVSISYGGKHGSKEDPAKEQANAKMFVPSANMYYTLSRYESMFGKQLNCGCSVCAGNNIDVFRSDYYGQLRKALRIHETENLISVYESIRSEIGKGTFGKYIKNIRNSKTVTQALSASKTQKRFP